MRIATRHCALTAAMALAAVAMVWPVWLQPERVDPCVRSDVLTVTGLIPGSVPDGERREYLSDNVIQWSEGTVPDSSHPRDPLAFRILRSYEVLRTSERPLMLLADRVEPEQVTLELADAPGGPLPIHVVRGSGASSFTLVVYLYVFDNEPVRYPFLAQLRGALIGPRSGRRPVTLFLVAGAANGETEAARRQLAVSWIVDAWRHYRGMCLPAEAASTPGRRRLARTPSP